MEFAQIARKCVPKPGVLLSIGIPLQLLVASMLLSGQTSLKPASGDAIRQDEELKSVLESARGAPPEFAADALIQIAQSSHVDPPGRIGLLKEAFRLAEGAQEGIAMRLVYQSGPYLQVHRTFGLGFDRVSLQSRAVRGMLPLDQKSALDLFEQIRINLTPTGNCDELYTHDLTIYYSVLGQIVRANQAGAGSFVLRQALTTFSSEDQVRPLAELLSTLADSPDFPGAVLVFADRLTKLDKEVSAFSADSENAIHSIAKVAEKTPAASRDALLAGARARVIKGSSHGVCRPRQRLTANPADKTITREPLRTPAERYNDELALLGSSRSPSPIAQEEIDAVGLLPAAPLMRYSDSRTRLSQMLAVLAQDDMKDTLRWKEKMEDFISALCDWKGDVPDDDPNGANTFFLEKAALFHSVISLAAVSSSTLASAGSQSGFDRLLRGPKAEISGRERAQQAFMAFLEGPESIRVYNTRRIVWFAAIEEMLRRYEKADEPGSMLSRFENSRNTVLVLSGRLYKFLVAK